MVSITSLWLAVLLSAVLVFFASFVMHMVLKYHNSEFRRPSNEDEALDALRRLNLAPGDYVLPYAGSSAAMKDPAFIAKMTKGPIVFMTVQPGGPPTMTTALVQWFIYCLVVGVFAAYIAGRALPVGAPYLDVFRFAGCTAFLGYALAQVQQSIWWKRSWSATAKHVIDGLVYGLLTAGTFGWLWPR